MALAVVLLALALRLLGIRLGLPFFHHPDECWTVDNAKSMAKTDDWHPSTYQYGAPLSAIAAWIYRILGDHRPSLRWFDPDNPPVHRVLLRLATAVISSSGAAGIYIAARYAAPGEDSGRRRGLYAALLYATAGALVTHGRYGVTDADLVAWVAWALGFSALFLRRGGLAWAGGTVVCAATAFAFKVTAGTALIIPALTFAVRPIVLSTTRLPRWARIAGSRAAMLGAIPAAVALFFLLNPHVILDHEHAFADIQNRAKQTIEGGFPASAQRMPGLEHLLAAIQALGLTGLHRWEPVAVIAAALGVAGIGVAVRERAWVCLVGAAQAAIAVLAITLTSKGFMVRNYLTALPVLCVGFGFAMDAITRLLRRWAGARWWSPAHLLPAAFAAFFVAVPIGEAVRAQQLSDDARVRAVDWIAAQAHGKDVTVAWTPDVTMESGYRDEAAREQLKRPHVLFAGDVGDPGAAARSQATYVAIVSVSDQDFDENWPFRRVDGYQTVATFEASPYEELFLFSVMVLARKT
jgi:4-amino-4-deoxy-L-arabinose transferase-like glycosyltransferase